MSGTTHPEKTAFEKAHSQFTLPKVNTIEQVELPGDPPGFIHQKKVNGQNLFFLGEDHQDYEQLKGHYFRVDKMVIPKYARMVNAAHLRALLKTTNLEDESPIDVSDDQLFHSGKLNSSVLLEVVGMVSPFTYRDMHFHFCDNHDPEKQKEIEELSGETRFNSSSDDHPPISQRLASKTGQCPQGVTSFAFNDMGTLQRNFVVFYITKEDLHKAWNDFNTEDPDVDIDPYKDFLKLYFTDKQYDIKSTSKDDNPKINWDTIDVKGIFFIPGSLPGNQIIYQSLLNVAGKSNTNIPVKKTLHKWLGLMDKLNGREGKDQVLEIGGYDFVNMWLEPLSIYIGKNFDPVVLPADKIYSDDILENKLS